LGSTWSWSPGVGLLERAAPEPRGKNNEMLIMIGIVASLLLGLLKIFLGVQVAFIILIVPFSCYLIFEPRQWPQVSFLLFTLGVAALPVPYAESDFGGKSPEEFLYWAVALSVPAACALAGVYLQPKREPFWNSLPRDVLLPTLALALTGIASVLYGIIRGGVQVADCLRQASGLAVFCLYLLLAFKLSFSDRDMERIFGTVRNIVLLYSIFYVFYYLTEISRIHDFVRERSPLLFFAGLFASITIIRMLFFRSRRNLTEVAYVFVFLAASILSGSRSVAVSFLVTAAIFFYARYPSLSRKMVAVALLGVVFLIQNPFNLEATSEGSSSPIEQIVYRFITSPTADSSYLGRISEMVSIFRVVADNPVLGQGMGASLVWIDPFEGEVESPAVDTGIGYILLKAGFVGLSVFLWWSFIIIRRAIRLWRDTTRQGWLFVLVCLVFYCAFLPFGPSFFQFSYSFWIGCVVGFLLWKIRSAPELAAASFGSLGASLQS